MTIEYKITARTIEQKPIGSFTLSEGETLDDRVAKELDDAITSGSLDRLATRVGLPAIAVTEVAEGENLAGGENVTAHHLYAPDGAPLAERSYRTERMGDGVGLFAVLDDHDETAIGVLASQEVADQIGQFWRNGHISLGS